MTKYVSKPEYIEAVEIPRNILSDYPIMFYEIPDWLKQAFDNRKILPQYSAGDYWMYYIVDSEQRIQIGTPGDYIALWNSTLVLLSKTELAEEYMPMPNTDSTEYERALIHE